MRQTREQKAFDRRQEKLLKSWGFDKNGERPGIYDSSYYNNQRKRVMQKRMASLRILAEATICLWVIITIMVAFHLL